MKLEKRYAAGRLPAEQLHLVQGDRQRRRPPGDVQRRQLARQLPRTCRARRVWAATTSRSTTRPRVVWEVPYGKGRKWGSGSNAFVNAILGGWRLTGINTMTSGQPINITYAPPAAFQVSHCAHLPARTIVGGDIYSADRSPNRTTSTTRRSSRRASPTPNDPSQPFGNLGRNVARTEGDLQLRRRRAQGLRAAVGIDAARVPGRVLQPVQHDEPGRGPGQRAGEQLRHDHRPVVACAADSVCAEAGVLVAIRPQAQKTGRARWVPTSSPTQWKPSRASHS